MKLRTRDFVPSDQPFENLFEAARGEPIDDDRLLMSPDVPYETALPGEEPIEAEHSDEDLYS